MPIPNYEMLGLCKPDKSVRSSGLADMPKHLAGGPRRPILNLPLDIIAIACDVTTSHTAMRNARAFLQRPITNTPALPSRWGVWYLRPSDIEGYWMLDRFTGEYYDDVPPGLTIEHPPETWYSTEGA